MIFNFLQEIARQASAENAEVNNNHLHNGPIAN